MIRRTTWVLLIVLVVLIGAAWYILGTKPAPVTTTATITPTPSKLLGSSVTSNTIKGLEYKNKSGMVVSIQRQINTWLVTEPANSTLTQGNITEIITQLLDLNIQMTLDTPPLSDAIGLTSPAFTMTITTDTDYVITIGDVTPTGTGYYIQVNQDKPVIVNKPGIDRINELFTSAQNTPTPIISTTPAEIITPTP